MAGNTKLRGFSPGGVVEFERWGTRIPLKLPLEAVSEIRRLCTDLLPRKPPERTGILHPDDFDAAYDESMGRIQVSMSPQTAQKMSEVLKLLVAEHATIPEVGVWADELGGCYQAHLDYLDTNEPGVK